MVAVDEQHILGGEVDARYLCTYNGQKQLQAYYCVAAHRQLAVAAYVLALARKPKVGCSHYVGGRLVVVAYTMQELYLLALLSLCNRC